MAMQGSGHLANASVCKRIGPLLQRPSLLTALIRNDLTNLRRVAAHSGFAPLGGPPLSDRCNGIALESAALIWNPLSSIAADGKWTGSSR
jgi:hypothetical protein